MEARINEAIYVYDPAEAQVGPEAIAIFMADAFETSDADHIAQALGVVARAKGMGELAKETGLSRQQLYRSFSKNGNPTLKTLLAVTRALGVDMTARPHPVSACTSTGSTPTLLPRPAPAEATPRNTKSPCALL